MVERRQDNQTPDLRRIQVWFGNEVIASHQAPAWQARRYVTLMGRRFAGLRITIDGQVRGSDPLLPQQLEWDRIV